MTADDTSLFRDINEAIRDLARTTGAGDDGLPFVCECDDAHCFETIKLSADEYDDHRRLSTPVAVDTHVHG
jgi:hypothetical protein